MFEREILGNLQKLASICSTFVLQTMGMSAFREGNLISLPGMDTSAQHRRSLQRVAHGHDFRRAGRG